jgi:hypothetical protein
LRGENVGGLVPFGATSAQFTSSFTYRAPARRACS